MKGFVALKGALSSVLRTLPGGVWLLRARNRWQTDRRLRKLGDASSVFTHHYHQREWGDGESASGTGSTLEYTSGVRDALPPLLTRLNVGRMLDAPCGDFHWMQHVAWQTSVHYLGGDIVKPLVDDLARRYTRADRQFIHLDITRDSLPRADLWLCRDCLFHLSTRDIFLALENFLRSDISYLLTSTHPDCRRNTDVVTGGFRQLNLLLPPFGFPPPQFYIEDWIPGYPRRLLALWTQDDLRGRRD